MEHPIQALRWGVAGLLLLGFLWLALLNWKVFWTSWVRRRHAPSWVPLLAGAMGALGLLAAPNSSANALWWLPLLVDWGSAPGILHALAYHGLRRIRGGQGASPLPRPFREIGFPHVDLCDSIVLGWRYAEDELVVELELSLLASHPEHEAPEPGERARFLPGVLTFSRVRSIDGLLGSASVAPSVDADGTTDHDTLHGLWWDGADGYALEGELGEVKIRSDAPYVQIAASGWRAGPLP